MITIPGKILAHQNLSAADKLIYGVIYTSGGIQISYGKLAEITGVNKMTAYHAAHRLAAAGLIKTKRRGGNMQTIYTLTGGGKNE